MRLTRSRKGKTPIDVTVVEQQPGQKRIRITVGDDSSRPSNKKNSDLDFEELDTLIVMLTYHLQIAKGEIEVDA